MVVAVRAEALITARSRLREGLGQATRELDAFRRLQSRSSSAFSSSAARQNAAAARQAAFQSRTFGREGSIAALAGTSARALGAVGGAYAAISAVRHAEKSARSFEKEIYSVQRATDTSGDALKAQENTLLDLSRATGKTKEELAQLYAAGGFAGRPARELARFTEYAAKATVSWGTNAEETGQAMAEIGNIYQVNQRRIEEIGDVINTVADKSASKEKDLLEYLTRVGGAGKSLGISAENMIAFGAAMKEVGVRTDVAATGIQAVFNKALVQDDDFDEELKKIGVNVKSFRKLVDKDATGAILVMLKALDKLKGAKRQGALKDMFGLEYADDVGRLSGSLPRLIELLAVANDRKNALGTVRKDFTLALTKDFNKVERATASMEVMAVRIGNSLKSIGGSAAEAINEVVDTIEQAEQRADRLKRIDAEAKKRAGEVDSAPSSPSAPEKSTEQIAIEQFKNGKMQDREILWMAKYSKDPKVAAAAEDEHRRRRFTQADKEGDDKSRRLTDLGSNLLSKGILASPGRLDQQRAAAAMKEAEKIRIVRLQRELDHMKQTPDDIKAASDAKTGLVSQQRLGSFGSLPITLGKGKAAKTYDAPKLDLPPLDDAKGQVEGVKTSILGLGPAGQSAGSMMAGGFTAGLSRMEAEASAAIARIQQKLDSLRAPSLSFGTGAGGLPVGKSMPEVR